MIKTPPSLDSICDCLLPCLGFPVELRNYRVWVDRLIFLKIYTDRPP